MAQKASRGEASEDELEALARRYGAGTLQVLPLRSGRLVVFDSTYQLIAITTEAPTIQELQEWSSQGEERMRQIKKVINQKAEDAGAQKADAKKEPALSAEELGL